MAVHSITIITGILFAALDIAFIQRSKNPLNIILTAVLYPLFESLSSLAWMKYVCEYKYLINYKPNGTDYLWQIAEAAFVFSLILFVIHALLTKKLKIKKDTPKYKALKITLKVLSCVFFALGTVIYIATSWGEETWGRISADQMIINLISPTDGTSDAIVSSILKGPVLNSVIIITIFSLVCVLINKLTYTFKEKEKTICSPIACRIFFLAVSLFVFASSVSYGIDRFSLQNVLFAFADPSPYIDDNYVNPNDIELKFPEKKRNLIHIYLESVENTYFSPELGGYGFKGENLMPDLAQLTKEGYNFSHLPKGEGIGGHHMSKGATWSVASMVNMNTGLPMKVPVSGNSYGQKDNFLPGVTALGDILKNQGYNQTLMFGADAAFGGLNFFYESHGDFKILDYHGVINEGWLDPNYKVWWGFEDDKLYEYAKWELTRLAGEGKPFNFTMETADTHFPNGYLSENCTDTPYESQYANVIKYSQAETVKFIRWIQEQDFYENTTIVIIGDHLSMDKRFFTDYVDPSFDRTCYSLILNPADSVKDVPETALYERQWAAFDMFPTILSSLGVEIPGNRLGLGTDLFSGEQTLFERDGVDKVNEMFEYRSTFYEQEILQ